MSFTEKAPLLDSQGYDREHLEAKKRGIAFPSCRHVLVVMAFLAYVNQFALRADLSVAVVSMVSSNITSGANDTTTLDTECLPEESTNVSHQRPVTGEFYWSKKQQGVILGAYFYGYVSTQLVGGRLAERFGGKHPAGSAIFLQSLLTLFTPLAARTSYTALVVLRILGGISGGMLFASLHVLLSNWASPYERSKFGSIIYAGSSFGNMIAMPVTGVLCDTVGWPWTFYFFGSLGLIWWVFWLLLVYSKPSQHPRISATERQYVEEATNLEGRTVQLRTPWTRILTSMPFFAIVVATLAHNWGYYIIMTCLPLYMNDILHFDIASNGILSGIPQLAFFVGATLAGILADHIRLQKIARTVVVRKSFTCIGLLGPAVCLLLAVYIGCEKALAVACFALASGMAGFVNASALVNHLDIAPRFVGTLAGMSTTVACIPGFLAPQTVTGLTEKENTRQQWIVICYISAAINVFGAIFYAVFASGVEQKWAKVEDVASYQTIYKHELQPDRKKKTEVVS